jgi:hypothetical protein
MKAVAPRWFAGVVVSKSSSESTPDGYVPLFEESIVLVRAASPEDALQKLDAHAEREIVCAYPNQAGEVIAWTIEHILDVQELKDPPDDGTTVYARHFRDHGAYRRFEPLLDGSVDSGRPPVAGSLEDLATTSRPAEPASRSVLSRASRGPSEPPSDDAPSGGTSALPRFEPTTLHDANVGRVSVARAGTEVVAELDSLPMFEGREPHEADRVWDCVGVVRFRHVSGLIVEASADPHGYRSMCAWGLQTVDHEGTALDYLELVPGVEQTVRRGCLLLQGGGGIRWQNADLSLELLRGEPDYDLRRPSAGGG